MQQTDARQLATELTSKLLDNDNLNLSDLMHPDVGARFDESDDFLKDIYDDLVQAVSTRPADKSLQDLWRSDWDMLDVVIDHYVLRLPWPTASLADMRNAVRAKKPTSAVEIRAFIDELVSRRGNPGR